MLKNPPDNWHFTVDPPPPPPKKKKKGCFFWGGGRSFGIKSSIFCFMTYKKFSARIRDRPDLPATFSADFSTIFCRFLHFEIQKFANIDHYYVILKDGSVYFWITLIVGKKCTYKKLHYLSEFLRLREIFKFFSTDNFKPVHMQLATLANRPAKLAKSAIFWMKPNVFLKKLENDPNSSLIKSAGSGRSINSWPEICSASPKGTSTYS